MQSSNPNHSTILFPEKSYNITKLDISVRQLHVNIIESSGMKFHTDLVSRRLKYLVKVLVCKVHLRAEGADAGL